jgi:hypothetical protein
MTRLSPQEIAAHKIEKILLELDRTVPISGIGPLAGGRINISSLSGTGYLVCVIPPSVFDRYSAA